MRILGAVAHPDDMELMFGGTMARLAALGHTVLSLSLAAGELGAVGMTLEESRENRLREAAASSAVIGAEYYYAGIGDKYIFFTPEIRNKVCEIFRALRPDLIITHSPKDYIFDHEHTSMLARDAATAAPSALFATGAVGTANLAPATARVPYLYYCEPVHQQDIYGQPVPSTTYVDISEVMEIKARMFDCYHSQRAWMKERFGMDNCLEETMQWSAKTGQAAGFAYAEGFRQHVAPPFPKDNILAELLGARVIKTD